METRTCVLAALVAAAVALTAGAQPAGPRGVASSLRSSSGVPAPRKVFDFVIQKAEVRELGSGHFFLPPSKPSYGPPPPPPPPPPSPLQHSTAQQFKPSSRQPVQSSATSTDSEKLLKKTPPSKPKPSSKDRERDEETRRLLPNQSPVAATAKITSSVTQQQKESQTNRPVPVQLPPYFPINTYATYTVPTYFAQLPHQQLKNKENPQYLESASNSLGSVESAEQGEVPSLLGLDISRTSNGGRRGKTIEVENSEDTNPTVAMQYGTPRQETIHPEQTGTMNREEVTGSGGTNPNYSIESPSQKIVAADSVSVETVAARETAADKRTSSPPAEQAAQQVEATKAAIADAASRAVAGEVAGPGLALTTRLAPGARLVTALALRRHGGVAIAGPGGTAAAGSGGVAVVGPGGVAFARPNGLSVVGPGGRVVALPVGAPEPRAGEALPVGARVVAIGPTVYLHPADAQAPPLPPLTFY